MTTVADQFFDIPDNELYNAIFLRDALPSFWLDHIDSAVSWFYHKNSALLDRKDYPQGCIIGDNVFIHASVKLPPICMIEGPCYIGAYTEIRPFAYIRGNVIIGEHCVIGNSSEIKQSILLNHVQVPHFNYVGDSILGNYVHLGAGVIIANLRLDQANVKITLGNKKIDTGRRKFGAIIGDHAEIGCNSVINPGCVIAKNTKIRSLSNIIGFYE